ncbi:MAG TPA: ATP-binding protein, partial [Phototrophicaceae bacterium]|nr:ATP-binding protein [Phototrophicaceae bacterium]
DQLAIALHKAHLDQQIRTHAQELEQRVAERTELLRRAKERIESILASTGDAIILLDADGTVEQINPAFATLFGFSSEKATLISLLSLVDSDSVDTFARIVRSISDSSIGERTELVCVRQDGSTFDAEADFAPMSDGEPAQIIGCFRDITLRKQAERDLRSALEREKELGMLKMRFVSMVSHEFRTPLSSILSSSDLLKHFSDRMNDKKKLEHLDRIQAQVKRLTDLLEDMLFLSKSEVVGVQAKPIELDFEAFCKSLVDEIQLTAPNRTLQFTSDLRGLRMNVDPKLMRQVISNLLSNAVKYSSDNEAVELDLVDQEDRVLITVRDHGIGIPEEDLKHLFEIFHRAANVGSTPGTGVGLTIVKRAVEAHGGTIHVDSSVGRGTAIRIMLPITTAQSLSERAIY